MKKIFAGFGFGPIQAGLFAKEAAESGGFDRIVIAEVDADLVRAVRNHGNRYAVNVAMPDRLETVWVDHVELMNPRDPEEAQTFQAVLEQATEMATSLPSVKIYGLGGEDSIAAKIASALKSNAAPSTLVYTAENHNRAAEELQDAVNPFLSEGARPCQIVNTVIGKMSQVVNDPAAIEAMNLTPMVPGFPRAFLVEAFNRILVTKSTLPDFEPGIKVFEEKEDLNPFEEAKLYGHNAIHALLAYLGARRGLKRMSDLSAHTDLLKIGRDAFLNESGAALIKKYGGDVDPLFTEEGYTAYVDDLLVRMTNPYLNDSVARAARDPVRKLAPHDRLVGTMRLAMSQGITPVNMAKGVRAALESILDDPDSVSLPPELRGEGEDLSRVDFVHDLLKTLWDNPSDVPESEQLAELISSAALEKN